MKPQHDVGHQVCRFFARRFPNTMIVLGNNSRSWIAFYDGKKMLKSEGKSLPKIIDMLKRRLNRSDDDEVENLWETYYWSQYCDERRNVRYYRRNMPKKYLKEAKNKVEANTGRTTLDEFTEP